MVYGILFAWAWLAVLAADRGGAPRRVTGAAVALAALTLAALRGYSMDYDGYIELFDAMVLFDFPYPERLFLAKEPLMSLLIDGILWLQAGPQLMFVVMALLAIAMKHEVFSRVFRGDTAAAWAVTLSLHFFLHEFTQSRVAVAIAACFLALLAALEGRRKAWLGWCLFGFGWHVSALLFMTVSTALWLPRRWRVVGYAAGTAVIGALMLLAFEWVGSIDLRVGEYEGGAGVSGLMIAVIALNGIVADTSIRVAGDEMDKSIVNDVKRKYNLMIGQQTAESIKKQIGSAHPSVKNMTMEVKGLHLVDGLPKTLRISSEEVREALEEPLSEIVEALKRSLEQTPPELAADIVDRGIVLTGGGSLLKGIDVRLKDETALPINLVEDPLSCVVLGTGKILDNIEEYEQVIMRGSDS